MNTKILSELVQTRENPSFGSCLQGYQDTPFAELVEAFGEPMSDGDGYKVDAEWVLVTPDGTFVTIYNYKDGKNYNGDCGYDVEDIRDWHIGGHDSKALEAVANVFGVNKVRWGW